MDDDILRSLNEAEADRRTSLDILFGEEEDEEEAIEYGPEPQPAPRRVVIRPRRRDSDVDDLERRMAESTSDESEFEYGKYDPYEFSTTPKIAFQTPDAEHPVYEDGEKVKAFTLREPQNWEPFFPRPTPWAGEGALKRYEEHFEQAADYPLMYANHRERDWEDRRNSLRILFGEEEPREWVYPDPRPIGPQRKDVMKFKIDDLLDEDMDDVMHEMISNHYRYGVEIRHDVFNEKNVRERKALKPGFEEFIRNSAKEYFDNYHKKNPQYIYPELPEEFYAEEVRRTESEENARAAQQAFESTRSLQDPSRLPGSFRVKSSGYPYLSGPRQQFGGKGKGKARGNYRISSDFDGPRSEFSENKGGKIKIVADREFSYGGLGDCVVTGTLFAETADVSPAFKSIVSVIDRKQDQVDTSYEESHVLEMEVGSLRQQLTDIKENSDFDQQAFAAEEKTLQAKLEKAMTSLNELNDEMEIKYVTGFKEDHGTPEKLIAELEALMEEQAKDIPGLEEELKKLNDAKDVVEAHTNQLNSDLQSKMKMNKQADRQFNTLKCRKEALFDKCEEIRGSSSAAFEAYQELYYTVDELMQDNSTLIDINKKLAKKITFFEELNQEHSYIQEVIIDPDCSREEYEKIFKKRYDTIKEKGRAKMEEIQEMVKKAEESDMTKGERPAPPAEGVPKTKSDLIRRFTALREAEAKKAKAISTKSTMAKKTFSKSNKWK